MISTFFYKRIVRNLSMQLSDEKTSRLHNIYAISVVIALTAHNQVIRKKLYNLTLIVHVLHQPIPIRENCVGGGESYNYKLPFTFHCTQNFQRQQNNPHYNTYNSSWRDHPNFLWMNNMGKKKKFKFRRTHQAFNSNERKYHLCQIYV